MTEELKAKLEEINSKLKTKMSEIHKQIISDTYNIPIDDIKPNEWVIDMKEVDGKYKTIFYKYPLYNNFLTDDGRGN